MYSRRVICRSFPTRSPKSLGSDAGYAVSVEHSHQVYKNPSGELADPGRARVRCDIGEGAEEQGEKGEDESAHGLAVQDLPHSR